MAKEAEGIGYESADMESVSEERRKRFADSLKSDDGWGEAGRAQYKLVDDAEEARGPLQHERTRPLPVRVKSGRIAEDKLVVETSATETLTIPWDKVRFVNLGVVREQTESDAHAYGIQKLVNGMGKAIKGTGDKQDNKIINVRESNILDLVVEGIEALVRFDSASVNYRSFLRPVSYVSFQNYFRLVHLLTNHCRQARFSHNVDVFLRWRREELEKYADLIQYENSTENCLANLDLQVPYESLDFRRKSWANEWSES